MIPILVAGALALLSVAFLPWYVYLPMIILAVFVTAFFRNPERRIPSDPGAVVSPADGRVVFVGEVTEDRYLKAPAKKISVFMSVFNVHVNRVPFSGTVEQVDYNPGKFLVASKDKASLDNEQNAVLLKADRERRVLVIQIAGMVARRIVCYLKAGDRAEIGKRFGLIMFGSRLDLFLPPEAEVLVSVGDHVRGGSSIVGRMP